MATSTKDKYIEAVGRRKTAVARVRLNPSAKASFKANDKELEDYFPTEALRQQIKSTLEKVSNLGKFEVTAKVVGGGTSSQAEAVVHGLARAMVKFDPKLKPELKKEDLLTRDPRAKERRKFGLKKARKSPQWSKR